MKWIFELIVNLLIQQSNWLKGQFAAINTKLDKIEQDVLANGAKLDQILEAIKAPPDIELSGFVDPPINKEQ